MSASSLPVSSQFLFQKDFARFIQNAVVRPAIAEVQTNRELVSFENHLSIYANSASLLHSRSPFLCATSASILGSLMHPAETGLLIPSVAVTLMDLLASIANKRLTAGVNPLNATLAKNTGEC